MGTYRQRKAAGREATQATKTQSAAQRADALAAELARLQARYDDCNASRLYWRGRCRELGAPELQQPPRG
jgi:hypothetical protein